MKRCPQCNRVEPDSSLAFCRVDGTALIEEALNEDSGRVRFNSAHVSVEASTSILPSAITKAGTTPGKQTTVLPSQHANENTRALARGRHWQIIVALVALITVTAIVVDYFYWRSYKVGG